MRSQQHETTGADHARAVVQDDGRAHERWRDLGSGRDTGDSPMSTRWCRF